MLISRRRVFKTAATDILNLEKNRMLPIANEKGITYTMKNGDRVTFSLLKILLR